MVLNVLTCALGGLNKILRQISDTASHWRSPLGEGPGRCDRRELEKLEEFRAGAPLPAEAFWDDLVVKRESDGTNRSHHDR